MVVLELVRDFRTVIDSWKLLGSASSIMKARRVRDNDFQEASVSPQWQGGEFVSLLRSKVQAEEIELSL
jgi:hypothetical protein